MRALRAASLCTLLGLAACQGAGNGAPEAPASPRASANPDARVLAIADAYVADVLDELPGSVARLRPPGMAHDRLPDDSLAGVAAREGRRAGWLAELRGIERGALGTERARLAYDLATSRLEDGAALRVCRFERWRVSQMQNGWPVAFADMAMAQPVDSKELRAQALARYEALPRYADAQTEALRAGLVEGRVAPRVVVELVVGQLDGLLAAPPDADPFASPALRSDDAAFRERYLALERDVVRPALRRHRDFLANEYAPRARSAVGVSANPDGAACYRAALRWSTTLDLDPAAVHERGLAALDEIEAEMREVSASSFGAAPLRELLERLRSDPAFLYRDREHVMGLAQAALERAWAALPRGFGRIPEARAILEPIPAFQERTAAAHYLQAALDGSQPAAYRVRLYEPARQSWTTGESTAFHEIVPGHHLQIALANENGELPEIARFLFTSGFSEGWALYAERVADELGLYSGPADRLGMLNNRAWRAVRMVVDTGLHVLGWSRERAIEFMLAHTALSGEQAAQEIDRYIAWPGQAPSYLLGYEEILALRAEAEQRLGARFDLRAFHDAVLAAGGQTLPVLRARMERWMQSP
jgi:uncharacterized protein (DUF885 family)